MPSKITAIRQSTWNNWELSAFKQITYRSFKQYYAVAKQLKKGILHLKNAEGDTPEQALENLRKLL